jgi:hypothetical protein
MWSIKHGNTKNIPYFKPINHISSPSLKLNNPLGTKIFIFQVAIVHLTTNPYSPLVEYADMDPSGQYSTYNLPYSTHKPSLNITTATKIQTNEMK